MDILTGHPHWSAVVQVCEKLQKAGFVAWLAGGCVRDGLLGRNPRDFDVATDASPDQVEALFEKSINVGKEFGVMVIPCEGVNIEVATFRRDGEYSDGRRPEKIEYTSAEEDAQRRDFTINGLFYEISSKKIMDYVGGQVDLKQRLIRAIGQPGKRFSEDHLRLLRAVRFVGELDFDLCEETKKAVTEHAQDLKTVSDERKRDELLKLLKSPYRLRALGLLKETKMLQVLFKEYVKDKVAWSDIESFFQVDENIPQASEPEELLWALWLLPWTRTLGELGDLERGRWCLNDKLKKKLEKRVETLRLSRQQGDMIVYALMHFDTWFLRDRLRRGHGVKIFAEGAKGLLLRQLIQRFEFSRGHWDMEMRDWEQGLQMAGANLIEGTLPEPLVTGKWLQEKGVKPGRRMGEFLEELYLLQLEGLLMSLKDAEKWLQSKS